MNSFTKSILSYLESISDPKPGRVSRGILPMVQSSSFWQNPSEINFNVSLFLFQPVTREHLVLFCLQIKICTAKIVEPDLSSSLENVVKVTAGLIAAFPLTAEIKNLQEHQRQNLRVKIKYPDQNIHIVAPRMRDLKKTCSEEESEMNSQWRLRTNVLLSHGVWTESSQVEISICLAVKPSNELEISKPVKIYFAPKPIRKGI